MLPSPNPAVLFQPVSEGAILLHTEQEIYFGLNSVGVEIWQMLPPACSRMEEVCDALAQRYPEVPEDDLRSDVAELLETLTAQGLVIAPGAE
jgi:hypothetical protein